MKFYVGVTDRKWFEFLKRAQPDEVNFWRPSAKTGFRALEEGAPFLFKLHRPDDFIVGGGFFSGYSQVPLTMAWDAFGAKNGAASLPEFRTAICGYRSRAGAHAADPDIGCIILSNPFFFDEPDWIPAPPGWAPNIVQGRGYDNLDEIGHLVWSEVSARLCGEPMAAQPGMVRETSLVAGPTLGPAYLRTARLGQGAFRLMTLENYEHRCCITGEATVPVLEAAHIRPVSDDGEHSLQNGLLMRADMHILFDRGLIGVDPDYRIRVSSRIREHYLNGRVYYAHDGQPLRSLPKRPDLRPDPGLLKWHMDEVFVA